MKIIRPVDNGQRRRVRLGYFRALNHLLMGNAATVAVSRRSLAYLRISFGVIYLWFGALKFFHGYSPAEDLAIQTIDKLTFHLIPQPLNIRLLATWECAAGVLLMAGKWQRGAFFLLLLHLVCTFTPLLFFPELSFKFPPYGFTLVGQYVMKNLILVCALLVLRHTTGEPSPGTKGRG
jgi:uncharacterized membrane protein YphA (DoxX/SURF4 family)